MVRSVDVAEIEQPKQEKEIYPFSFLFFFKEVQMILEEETFKMFGYRTCDLSPQSSKKIIVSCDECGGTREVKKREYRIHCKSCAARSRQIKRWDNSAYREKNVRYTQSEIRESDRT